MEPNEFELTLKDLDTRLDRLKALYEMYFQGIERIEPAVPRKEVDRIIARLRREQPRTTHLRFKFQSTIQRYTTLQTYWRRITRQIEEGTYTRDLKRMKRRQATRARRIEEREEEQPAYELDLDADLSGLLDDPELDAVIAELQTMPPPPRPAPAPPPATTPASTGPKRVTFGKPTERRGRGAVPTPSAPRARPPAPAASAAARQDGPDSARMKRIYDDYVSARRSNNERVDNVKIETIQRSIEKMMPKLKEKHRGKAIDFEVVVRDGRVGLKPVPK